MTNVTIKDIAERTGVSYATVSRAINGKGKLSKETRRRVLAAAEEMGYTPNAIARSLVMKQSYTIALILADISNPFFAGIADAATQAAYQKGYHLLLCNTGWDPELERQQLDVMMQKRVDGIILKPADEIRADFSEIHTPLVLLDHSCDGETSYIEMDNKTGGYLAGEHLAKCGYRHIGFIGNNRASAPNAARLSGFRQALLDNGLPVDESVIRSGPYTIESGLQIAHSMMQSDNPPDALFCVNDLVALGAWQCMDECGVSVPDEFGIVGFDDIFISALPRISMTSIAQPRRRMGELAVNMIINAIEAGAQNYTQKLLLQPELRIRGSTKF